MKKLLAGAGAIGFMLGCLMLAQAGQLPFIKGPIDPSNQLANLNTLTANVNGNVGQLTATGTAFSTATGTGEQTAASYTIPPTLVTGPNPVLHQRCWGTRANNGDVVTAKLYFGAQSASLVVVASAATNWEIEAWTSISGVAINATEFKSTNTGVASVIAEAAGTDNLALGTIVTKCTLTDGSSSAGDGVMNGYFLEIIH